MKKNVASQIIGAQLVSATDGSAVTTGTTTIYVTGDGGTQAAGSVGSGACTHEGNGYWTYAPAQAETNYDQIGFTFVNTSACNVTVQVYPTFPQTGDNFARLGAPAGASVSADVAAMKVDTAAILVDTAEIGVAGAGLTNINLPNQTMDIVGNITGNLSGSVGSVTGAVGSVTGAVGSVTAGVTVTTNNDKTGYAIASGGVGSGAIAAAELNSIADAILDRNMATGVDSGTDSTVVRTPRQSLRILRNKTSVSGGTATITKEDDTTTSWTAAVATAAGDPISSVDPT